MGDNQRIANMVDEAEDETGIQFHTLLKALSLMHPTDQMIDIIRIRYVFEKARRFHDLTRGTHQGGLDGFETWRAPASRDIVIGSYQVRTSRCEIVKVPNPPTAIADAIDSQIRDTRWQPSLVTIRQQRKSIPEGSK